jgi:hypothetical protein
MKLCPSQINGSKGQKLHFLPHIADYRPKTNAAILWVRDHTKEMLCTGGIGQGKETKNLNVADVLMVQELI